MLVLPIVAYGYTGHVMDFPGTINNDFEHFMHHVLDITKIAGLPRLQEDHPAQRPRLEHAEPRPGRPAHQPGDRRRVRAGRLVEPADGGQGRSCPRWRQSKFPGGCAHACELETSLYLYLDGDNVRKDQIKNGTISFNEEDSPFNWVDLFAAGPATVDLVDQQLLRDRRAGRGRAGHGREGPAGLRGGGQAARALRHLVQGPAQGRAPRPPPQAADHADPVGPAAGEVVGFA